MIESARQLAAAGIPTFPCSANKVPAVGKGVDWKVVANLYPDQMQWPSGVVGVPVPPGVTVIDLDTYKGVTRERVERALGCALPWDAALIQHTQSGGEHYAFAADWDARQDSDLFKDDIGKGFDTRCGGRGYIATGAGYQWAGNGLLALAYPGVMLPRLPDAARPALERVQREVTSTELPQGDRDLDLIREALRHINADCSRSEWVSTGMALKHHFHDKQDIGFALFREWSEYAADRLDYETLEPQWESFKVSNTDGASVTIATVIYKAMQAGWQPPSDTNTALAFGQGAAPVEIVGSLIDRLQERGGDPKATTDLLEEIKALSCSDMQRATLLATLHRELKDAGLLTKPVRNLLDAAVTGRPISDNDTRNTPGRYGKNHTENAVLFLNSRYPDGMLLRSEEVWYAYTGMCWVELDDGGVKHELFHAMVDSLPQDSTINGTYGVLGKMCHTVRKIGYVPHHLVVYHNGILDLNTWGMSPHTPEHFTTNILPYNYNPHSQCGRWLQFLNEIFEGDWERVSLLQEWFGYMMAASYRFHKIMLILGPPRSGKSTVGRILEQVAGVQNFSGGSLHAFASDKYLDSLRSKPVMFIGDAEQKISRNHVGTIIERMKTISGNDAITFDRIYKSSVTDTLPTRITIASNHTPSLFDDSGALAGRFLVLPINVTFSGREDIQLLDALSAELEGIAAWALAGLHRLNGCGRFTQPQASIDEAQYITETYSPLERFIDEVCLPVADNVITAEEMHDAYRVWATMHQEDAVLTRKVFTKAFKDATRGRFKYGTHRRADETDRGYKGVQLRPVSGSTAGNGTAAAFTPRAVP